MQVTASQNPNLESDYSYNLIKDLSFCVVDLETTGGNHLTDKIFEIGLIKIENLKIQKELTYLINPEIPIPEFIQKLTSIKQNDLKESPKIEDVIGSIIDFIGESILVAHNSSFDIPFLNSVLIRLKKPKLTNTSLCTNLMTKYLIPEIMNSNLSYMSQIFQIPHNRAHRALDDAMATSSLLIQYLHFFIEKKIKKVNQLYYPRKKYELNCAHIKKRDGLQNIVEKLAPINSPFSLLFKGKEGVILSLLPICNFQREQNFIKDQIGSIPWETLTIKLAGTFLETFFILNQYFPQLLPDTQSTIVNYLKLTHLNLKQKENDAQTINLNVEHDFFISRHLIPGQFIIYPITQFKFKSELIFRYPGHHKKLINFINHHLRNLQSGRKTTLVPHARLNTFFFMFLQQAKENNDENYFFFSELLIKKGIKSFQTEFLNFIMRANQDFNFPLKHI